MSTAQPDYPSIDCSFDTVIANLTPFYLTAAKGDQKVAAMTILELIKVHRPANAAEIELAGRIVGFAAAAADNLRLSMRPDLSDARILRYRTNAATLDRSAEKCRAALVELQDQRRDIQMAEAQQAQAQAQSTTPQSSVQPQAGSRFQPFAAMASELAAMRAATPAPQAATGSRPLSPRV